MREGWSKGTLGDLLSRRTDRLGSEPDPGVLTVSEEHGLVDQVAHWGRRIATEDVSKYKVVNFGDVVYNIYLLWAGAIGQSRFDSQMVTSPVYEVFRPVEGVAPECVGLILQDPKLLNLFDGISIGTVGRRRRAPWKDFLKVPVLVPPLHEQKRIVDLMDSADAAISAAQAEVSAAEDFLRKIRSAIPVAASSTPLGDLVKMRSGPSWKAADETAVPGPGLEPVLGITNTPSSGQIDLSTRKYVRGLSATTQRLTENSLVMIRTNGNRSRIGNVYRSTPEVEGFAVSAFQIAIEPIDKSNSDFLYWVLGSDPVQDSITESASGSTGLGNIAIGWLKRLGIPQLDESARTEYVENCNAANVLVTTSATALNCLRELRSSMLSVLLSGEHEIPESYDQFLDLSEVGQAG